MGAHKIGSYIIHYRQRKKEAAEDERRRRLEDAKKRPDIIDPSWEILGYKSPRPEQSIDNSIDHDHRAATFSSSAQGDWLFQARRASTMSGDYQLQPYCEVTPKSSISSSKSAASDQTYDMGWVEPSMTARPRPQSYLPSAASASYSMSMMNLHGGSVPQKQRHDSPNHNHLNQQSLPFHDDSSSKRASYRLEACLTKPFSINDPLDFPSEPLHNGTDDQQPEPDFDGAHCQDDSDAPKRCDGLVA
ncbi:hypothetical protein LTS08_003866 [Lithohypha guttulata]|nr:hypothetical protein LTS08_003866 [Lithohypha guttulata]